MSENKNENTEPVDPQAKEQPTTEANISVDTAQGEASDSQAEVTVEKEAQEEVVQEVFDPANHTIQGMLGRKLGMTQIFGKDGNVVSVTVVEAGPCKVLEVCDDASKVKIGFDEVKESRTNKPIAGFYKKLNLKPMRVIKQFPSRDKAPYQVGFELKADLFKVGDYVDVIGTSIGKGFAGGMKRHGWKGGPGGHGSMHHRRVGSIGASADPSRVLRGQPMPGHMGNKRITTKGLRVMEVDTQNNLLLLKGAVPGSKNGIITINISRTKAWKDLNLVREIVKHKVNPMKQSKAKAGKKKGGK